MTLIIGLGGTTREGSSTQQALEMALVHAEQQGARTLLFGAAFLTGLPHYGTPECRTCAPAEGFIAALREADGLIMASPGYHGTISGLLKNAIDYIEDTARDARPYLENLPVGLIATAFGWQATGSTLAAMRSITHALRGWPTPMGVTIRTTPGLFEAGRCTDPATEEQIRLMAGQVVDFARMKERQRSLPTPA
jgi:FMN reductase